jgi:exodeoxyribonuclease VII large subunit
VGGYLGERPGAGTDDGVAPTGGTLGVAEFTREVRRLLEGSFPRVRVRGEVTNLSRPQSGHIYFSLMDDAPGADRSRFSSAQVACVIWRSGRSALRKRLESGVRVVVSGRVTVYEPRGAYQIVVEQVESVGLGDLQREFEALKAKLKAEGLFDPGRKRPLPFLPRRIGLVTSPSGAAIRDVLRVLYRRHPRAWVRIVPVRVQGEGAVGDMIRALEVLGAGGEGQVDVIILTRGGGSLEDLWAFNDELLARAIAASRVPTVSAVGHEVDFSISDFVADQRAQTPTKAAEMVVPDLGELEDGLESLRSRLGTAARSKLRHAARDLERLERRRQFTHGGALVEERFERCDDLADRLRLHLYNRSVRWEDSLRFLVGRLEALSPLKVLARGYSVTLDASGRVVRDGAGLEVGQRLRLRFERGGAVVEVREAEGVQASGSADRTESPAS